VEITGIPYRPTREIEGTTRERWWELWRFTLCPQAFCNIFDRIWGARGINWALTAFFSRKLGYFRS
jgi:hypothetical protein